MDQSTFILLMEQNIGKATHASRPNNTEFTERRIIGYRIVTSMAPHKGFTGVVVLSADDSVTLHLDSTKVEGDTTKLTLIDTDTTLIIYRR